jgi:hypothetical protein
VTPWERIGDNNKAEVRRRRWRETEIGKEAGTTRSVIGEQGRWLLQDQSKRATLPSGWWESSPASADFG